MTRSLNIAGLDSQDDWLKKYYATRAAFSIAWIAAALLVARNAPGIAAILMVAYPAWDAVANLVDGSRSGGLARNRTQAMNGIVSVATAVAVALALPDMNRVLAIFGLWAGLSGLFQLGTGLRRWKAHGAQWAMILSGAQSALAGVFFIVQARTSVVPSIATVVGYAGFGAFYFLVSAVSLGVKGARVRRSPA